VIRRARIGYSSIGILDGDDLFAEGEVVALKAVDRFLKSDTQGNMFGFIYTAVRRYYFRRLQEYATGEKKVIVQLGVMSGSCYGPDDRWDRQSRDVVAWRKRLSFWKSLSARERGLTCLVVSPPADFVVMQRNVFCAPGKKITTRILAKYTGLSVGQIRRSLKLGREAATTVYGNPHKVRAS
jgi:hypothetical protein